MDHEHVLVAYLPLLKCKRESKESFEHRLFKNFAVADIIKLELSEKGIFMFPVDQQP